MPKYRNDTGKPINLWVKNVEFPHAPDHYAIQEGKVIILPEKVGVRLGMTKLPDDFGEGPVTNPYKIAVKTEVKAVESTAGEKKVETKKRYGRKR